MIFFELLTDFAKLRGWSTSVPRNTAKTTTELVRYKWLEQAIRWNVYNVLTIFFDYAAIFITNNSPPRAWTSSIFDLSLFRRLAQESRLAFRYQQEPVF